jgi:hypothetical protein
MNKMKKVDNIEQRRSQWLATGKQIVETCFAREAQLGDLCPQRANLLQKDKNQALRKISILSKEISKKVEALAEIERDQGFGFSKVLGNNADELSVVVLSLLLCARLDASVARSIRVVQDVMDYTAVRNPSIALQVRKMFRSDGTMFPFVTMGRNITLDELSVTLKESVLNRILGLPSDLVEARCEAEALLGTVKKGLIL